MGKKITRSFTSIQWRKKLTNLTLNSEKSAFISLLDGWCDDDDWFELDAIEDIDDESSGSIFLQMSSSFVAFAVLVVGGSTAKKLYH